MIESVFFELGYRINRAAMAEANEAMRQVALSAYYCREWKRHPPLRIDKYKGTDLKRLLRQALKDSERDPNLDDDSHRNDSDADDDRGGAGRGNGGDSDDSDNDRHDDDDSRPRKRRRGRQAYSDFKDESGSEDSKPDFRDIHTHWRGIFESPLFRKLKAEAEAAKASYRQTHEL